MLAPTRELAAQIADVVGAAGSAAGLATLVAYGGVAKPPQAAALRRGVDVLVATPGRLEDLMQDGACRWHPYALLWAQQALCVSVEDLMQDGASKWLARGALVCSIGWFTTDAAVSERH